MRKNKEVQESSASSDKETRGEEVVILTRTDKFGNTRPVNMSEIPEPQRGRKKREKVRSFFIARTFCIKRISLHKARVKTAIRPIRILRIMFFTRENITNQHEKEDSTNESRG
jgi:hypothetical protein